MIRDERASPPVLDDAYPVATCLKKSTETGLDRMGHATGAGTTLRSDHGWLKPQRDGGGRTRPESAARLDAAWRHGRWAGFEIPQIPNSASGPIAPSYLLPVNAEGPT